VLDQALNGSARAGRKFAAEEDVKPLGRKRFLDGQSLVTRGQGGEIVKARSAH
jgi:hypothetical protein